ncbi:cilia- and flagella-associated protein 119-like [Styela clava]
MSPVLNTPGNKKPKMCVWADLSVHDMDQIMEEESTNRKKQLLKTTLKLEESPRSEILLDLFLHTLRFAKTHKYKKDQTSALFSIVKQTHEVCTSTPFGNMQECFQFFREMMLLHSVHRPPWSVELFNAQQLEEITAHVINTFFRHYKLYKYAFTPKVRLDLSINYEGRAPSPEPIDIDDETETDRGPSSAGAVSEPQSPRSVKPESPIPKTPEATKEEPTELEIVVRKAVSEQLKQMQKNVEKQLEDTDKLISEKILNLEQGPASPKGKKSPKGSAKGKKK